MGKSWTCQKCVVSLPYSKMTTSHDILLSAQNAANEYVVDFGPVEDFQQLVNDIRFELEHRCDLENDTE